MDEQQIIRTMTLKEKIAFCSGADFWQTKPVKKAGLPSLFMCDGPHGLRKQLKGDATAGLNQSAPATCFPASVTLADSWNPALAAEIGGAIAAEAAACGVGLVLGPGVNIKRNPLCGRNFEYFSEDPYLAGRLACAYITAAQQNGVGCCIKHFACNNQEKERFTSDSQVDERTLRELYLPAFETAVRGAAPAAVMCAYNKLNGTHCSDSRALLQKILRNDWGFEGAVITDWGALNDRSAAFEAGCDLAMPGNSAYLEKEALRNVRAGKLSTDCVEASVRRILHLVLRSRSAGGKPEKLYPRHDALAEKAAVEGAVLLKNNGILPLREGGSVVLIGSMARFPRYQGSGSSHINPTALSSAVEAMPWAAYAEGCDRRGETSPQLLQQAVRAAAQARTAVVFVGLPDRYESEGFDRADMRLPDGHLRLVEAVAAANPNTVVLLFCGGAVECPFADRVRAILYMGLPGQAGGRAAAELLTGRASPGGRLAESWPLHYEDCPSAGFWGSSRNAEYREGLYVGYRYYSTARKAVRWPFGYGLGYTKFACSGLLAEDKKISVSVTNTGSRDGCEVVQLYISPPQEQGTLHRPALELKGFQKVFAAPGQSVRVVFELDDRSFAVWQEGWVVPGGCYGIHVGFSSTDLPLHTEYRAEGSRIAAPSWQAGSWYETFAGVPSRTVWEQTLPGPAAREPDLHKGSFTMENTVEELRPYSAVMRLLYRAAARVVGRICKTTDPSDPDYRMMMASSVGSPLRNLQMSGGLRGGLIAGLLELANGHLGKAVVTFLRG